MSTEPPEVEVKRFTSGDSEIAVFEFQGQLRDLVVNSLQKGYLTTGRYLPDERAVSSQGVMSMAVAGTAVGSTAWSAAIAPTLYVATANPASLMALGPGVGSAVMGAGGIVAQAPFIPVAATMPVLAPLMAVQVLSTAAAMRQFQEVSTKLDDVKKTLDNAIARTEATHVAELVTASKIVGEITDQYELTRSFSTDMLIRLAIAERDVHRLFERYRYLVDTQVLADVDDSADVEQLNHDVHSALLASFLDLQIAHLRVSVSLQDNPATAAIATRRLRDALEDNLVLWERFMHRSEEIYAAMEDMKQHVGDETRLKKIKAGLGGGSSIDQRIALLKDAYVSTLQNEKDIIEAFTPLIQSSKETLKKIEAPKVDAKNLPTLVYWEDENGQHSLATDSLIIR